MGRMNATCIVGSGEHYSLGVLPDGIGGVGRKLSWAICLGTLLGGFPRTSCCYILTSYAA